MDFDIGRESEKDFPVFHIIAHNLQPLLPSTPPQLRQQQ